VGAHGSGGQGIGPGLGAGGIGGSASFRIDGGDGGVAGGNGGSGLIIVEEFY
jgi:hypothetical protein